MTGYVKVCPAFSRPLDAPRFQGENSRKDVLLSIFKTHINQYILPKQKGSVT
jgi:hypothetical protein